MEYASKGSLADIIKKESKKEKPNYLPEKSILSYFLQMCMALKHIHQEKVLHRDIKPDHIFLFQNGVVKIGDFGVSKELEETMQLNSTLAGSPLYIAPEVFLKKYD